MPHNKRSAGVGDFVDNDVNAANNDYDDEDCVIVDVDDGAYWC